MKKLQIIHLLTDEGKRVLDGENPYDTHYPRPQLKRSSFFSLNGKWDLFYLDAEQKKEIATKINVPYPPESLLSGVGCALSKKSSFVYKRVFSLPSDFSGERVILNFGAVSGRCSVLLNGVALGTNEGGYNSFSYDITDYLKEQNEIEVFCHNEFGDDYPYGKQRIKRGGMWYTPSSGIWQSVWLEAVPREYIRSLKITPTSHSVRIELEGAQSGIITLGQSGKEYAFEGGVAEIEIDNPILWSPDNPHLYHFSIKAGDDFAESYFALREITVKEISGIKRICLNGEPLFMHGVLNQGYFSDGIYTPASPSLFCEDILKMKALGFNTLRMHAKVEADTFYYECDRLGMIVIQDMVNNGRYDFIRDTALPTIGIKYFPSWLIHRTKKQKSLFLEGLKRTVNQLYNHPCICYWTIFNEGWGQFEPEKMYDELYKIDKTRIIDSTSGWFKRSKSDVESMHVYFRPVKLKKAKLPIVLSEYGGYCCKIKDHSANVDKTYAYKFFKTNEEFESGLYALFKNEIQPLIKEGLCGAIYTQLSDVEDETNGLVTYDRKITKISKERFFSLGKEMKI